MFFAKDLISRRIVKAFPEQRLSALAAQIKAIDAHYCAVLKPFTYRLMGLVKFSDLAANPAIATRIVSDLMSPPPVCQAYDIDPVEKILELIKTDPPEIVVVQAAGDFVGLITPGSFIRWLFSAQSLARVGWEAIPAASRWSPAAPAVAEPGLAARARLN